MPLTTVSALKLHLGLPETNTAQDAFLGQLLEAAESAFLRLIGREIEAADYVDYYSGANNPVLLLREYPVISVSDVRVDGSGYWGAAPNSFGALTVLTAGVDYALVADAAGSGTGRLFRVNGVWPGQWRTRAGLLTPQVKPGAGNVKVSYRAGYEEVPTDVALCLWQVCARLRAERSTGRPIQAERYEEYAASYAAYAEQAMRTGSEATTVARYRRTTPKGDRALG